MSATCPLNLLGPECQLQPLTSFTTRNVDDFHHQSCEGNHDKRDCQCGVNIFYYYHLRFCGLIAIMNRSRKVNITRISVRSK